MSVLPSLSTLHHHHHPPPGWNKASLSVDASEENDGYSSGEDPMNSDPEDDIVKKLVRVSPKRFTFSELELCICQTPFELLPTLFGDPLTLQAPGKYTVVTDCEKAGPQELSVKSGDMVQLIREGEDGQW